LREEFNILVLDGVKLEDWEAKSPETVSVLSHGQSLCMK
jgi:hypothetical protein